MPARKNPRVDAYIAAAAPFARPILRHLRRCVHEGCPSVEETLKWGMPSFTRDGRILAYMAAFKAHAAFGFWKAQRLAAHGLEPADQEAMGQFGRLTSVADLPSKTALVRLVSVATKLDDLQAKPAPRRAAARDRALDVPADLAAALRRNRAAREAFASFSWSARKDYVEWITEAKRDETRQRRLAQAVAWMAEGKTRNWKYVRR